MEPESSEPPVASRARLDRPSYETLVHVILDDAGALESIEILEQRVDDAVVKAFESRAHFRIRRTVNFPDGRVYLPTD